MTLSARGDITGGRGGSFSGGGGGSNTRAFGPRGKEKVIREALATINPHYSEDRKWRINCQRCVYAYEMARRGYDVEAMPKIMSGYDEAAYHWVDMMENQTWEKMSSRGTVRQLVDKMLDWGDGARAVVYVVWKGRKSAHVFIAEQVRGGTEFVDPQTGRYVDIHQYLGNAIKGETQISRIDNLKPSSRIGLCAQKRKRGGK